MGKTTGIQQLIDQQTTPAHYASADDLLAGDAQWLREQWQHARLLGPNTLLAIDEIQKIPNWPETVISKDILQFQRVGKPALFRQAFEILCHYPAQEISYTKLLGQLCIPVKGDPGSR